MSLHTKLFVQFALIIGIILFIGSMLFIQSIDTIFDKQTRQNRTHDAVKIKEYLDTRKQKLQSVAASISGDHKIYLSMNLLSKYQNPGNYRAVIFDREKTKLLERVKSHALEAADAIYLYDSGKQGILLSQKKRTLGLCDL